MQQVTPLTAAYAYPPTFTQVRNHDHDNRVRALGYDIGGTTALSIEIQANASLVPSVHGTYKALPPHINLNESYNVCGNINLDAVTSGDGPSLITHASPLENHCGMPHLGPDNPSGESSGHYSWTPISANDVLSGDGFQSRPPDQQDSRGSYEIVSEHTSTLPRHSAFTEGTAHASISSTGGLVSPASTEAQDLTGPYQVQSAEATTTVYQRFRPKCTRCNRTFSRMFDLFRHEGSKHAQSDPRFQCGVAGCAYGGSHRADKLASHIKNLHLNNKEDLGIIHVGRGSTSFYGSQHAYDNAPIYCLPGSGGCALSAACLAHAASDPILEWRKFHNWASLNASLTADSKSLREFTRADVQRRS